MVGMKARLNDENEGGVIEGKIDNATNDDIEHQDGQCNGGRT